VQFEPEVILHCVFAFAPQVMPSCILVGAVVVAYVSCRTILNDVVKTLEGSVPFYSLKNVDGLYVATSFVIVPLLAEVDEFILLEATGCPSMTKDGVEEAAASALIQATRRDFGVVVTNPNFSGVEELRKKNEELRRNNMLLKSGWSESIDHVEILQKTLEHITLDAIDGSSRTAIGLLAHGAAVWAEESVWNATAAVEGLSSDIMDET